MLYLYATEETAMDLVLLRLFQKETLEQCRYILTAVDQLDRQTSNQSYDDRFRLPVSFSVAAR